MQKVHAVILAGGSGTRLWPMSRQQMPKQFLALDGELSLLEATVARLDPIIARENVLIVTSESSAMGEAFAPLAPYEKLLEPCGRNTAPAIALAATHFLARGEDPVMVVLPADHVIRNVPAFHACLRLAIEAAEEGRLVTFGIEPTGPETGFGYIKATVNGETLPKVERFKEKPGAAAAASFLAEGGWYWNSGMFVWKASAIMQAVEAALPDLAAVMKEIGDGLAKAPPNPEAVRESFPKCPSISIDHGVLGRIILCTDESHSATLVNEGHVNRAVMRAIAQGVPPILALQMATLNTAERFGVSRDVGMIAPGRFADILLVDDLSNLAPKTVVARGEVAVENGMVTLPRPDSHIPDWETSSIHLARPLTAQNFVIKVPDGAGEPVSPMSSV